MRAIATCEFLLSPALCDSKFVDDFFLSLTQLHSDLIHSSTPPLIEDDAYTKLLNSDRFPTDKVFSENIKDNGISVFSAPDITRIVNKILVDAKSLADMDDYWIQEWDNLLITLSVQEITDQRKEELRNFFSTLAIYSLSKNQPVCALHYCTASQSSTVVEGALIDAYPLEINYPVLISEEISIFHEYKLFLSVIGHEFFLAHAHSEYDLKLSLYAGLLKLKAQAGLPFESIELDSFSLGPDFVNSLKRNQSYVGGTYTNVVFDTVTSLLAGTPKNTVSPFRISSNSTTQRLSSDKSMRAFRMHITSSGVALRLLFWKRTDDSILLANIGPKNECMISE